MRGMSDAPTAIMRLVLMAALCAAPAYADETTPTPSPSPAPVQAPDWTTAPKPDQASGIAHDEATPIEEQLLWIPRTLLFLPRWTVWAAGQPVRGGAYAYERYDMPGVFKRTFFSVDGKVGLYPIATYESTFGFTAGARFVHHDMFGEGERLRLRANAGGRYQQAYGMNLQSGQRIPHATIEIDASYERRPHEPYFGIGNDANDETRFQEDVFRDMTTVQVPLVDALSVRVSNALAFRELMGTRVDNTRFEGELVYDSRRPSSIYASQVLDATGWYASVHAGLTRGFADDASRFTSYGGELQRYIDLYHGTRVLALRVVVDAVGDGTASFIDLPRLGGTEFLRGYPSGRFRDRAATLATAEYTWDLGNFLAAYTFVDVGRVWHSLADFTVEDPRVGYGLGVELHTTTSYVGRVQAAASRDGDFVLELVLSPAFPRRERIGRY
jgi:hypothetical protein